MKKHIPLITCFILMAFMLFIPGRAEATLIGTDIDTDGKIEAGYFNPRPIHVSRAEVSQEDSNIKVMMELRDVGYPGSTYTLVYVPEKDVLFGYYYHAVSGQYFDVLLVRLK